MFYMLKIYNFVLIHELFFRYVYIFYIYYNYITVKNNLIHKQHVNIYLKIIETI